jgi:hypothetical protein
VNRRIQGKVRHERKRHEKRRQIRLGHVMSQQQYLRNSQAESHTHEEDLSPVVLVQEPAVVAYHKDATHVLVRRDTDLATGQEVESEIERGTESKMRRLRQQFMQTPEAESTAYMVRKLK